MPDAIPYVTSYYSRRWGFCLSENELKTLRSEDRYKVVVDTSLNEHGVLNYGELILPGTGAQAEREILISTYICHPNLANDNLSGIVAATFLAKLLAEREHAYTYRFVFAPETIGSIVYIRDHFKELKARTEAAFNLTCIGDDRAYSYVASRSENTLSDLCAQHVGKHLDADFKRYSWLQRGSDERQYGSPLVNLPMVVLCRTRFGCYPEYHTSEDKLGTVVTSTGLAGGLNYAYKCVEAVEHCFYPLCTVCGEPQLGKRNLYPTLSAKQSWCTQNFWSGRMLTDILSLSDGQTSLIEIAERMGRPVWDLYAAVDVLKREGLVKLSFRRQEIEEQ